jgi:hypothetical protein
MPEPTLVPIAVKVEWRSQERSAAIHWPDLIRSFVACTAARIARGPQNVIGHIKGMVRSPGHLLRVNCVSASLPIDIEGDVPEGTCDVTLELVLLVYGLSPSSADEAIASAVAQVEDQYGLATQVQRPRDGHAFAHLGE